MISTKSAARWKKETIPCVPELFRSLLQAESQWLFLRRKLEKWLKSEKKKKGKNKKSQTQKKKRFKQIKVMDGSGESRRARAGMGAEVPVPAPLPWAANPCFPLLQSVL